MADIKPQFDIKSQWDRVVAYIIPGETLYAVFDCKGAGTGFVGISDQRVIFYDQGVFIKHKSMISIPFNHIVGIVSVDDGVIFRTSEIHLLTAAGKFEFQFRGADKAHWAYSFIMNQIMNRTNPQLKG